MDTYQTLTFDKLRVGDHFTCPTHRRIYVKISQMFAQSILTDEVYQFLGNEKVYKEND